MLVSDNLGHVLRRLEKWHGSSKTDSIVDGLAFFKELEGKISNFVTFLENPLLGTDLLQALNVLENCIDDLLIIRQTFFG